MVLQVVCKYLLDSLSYSCPIYACRYEAVCVPMEYVQCMGLHVLVGHALAAEVLMQALVFSCLLFMWSI